MDTDRKTELYHEYSSLQDGLYLTSVLEGCYRRRDKLKNMLIAAATWEEVIRLQGEIKGIDDALSEIIIERPEQVI